MIKILLLFLFLLPQISAKTNQLNLINSSAKPIPVQILTGDTVYYENFENGLNGWTVVNLGQPTLPSLWHLTNSKSVSPVTSAGWFDTLTNSYPHLSYEALVSPDLLIPSNALVYLSFDVFIHLAPNGTGGNDFFDIQITTNNGSTWSDFSQFAYSGQQIGWKNYPFDFTPETGSLTSFAGKTVKFRFLVSTDNSDPNGEGVFIDNFRILKTDCETEDPFEPNNSLAQAASITPGQMIYAAVCPVGDQDFYEFSAAQNDRINLVIEHSVFQIQMAIFNSSGTMVASTGGTQLFYNVPSAGIYKVRIMVSDIFSYTPAYRLYLNIINTQPDIIMVSDIPGDEGLNVRVNWQYSIFDPPNNTGTIKEYHLFRKVDDTSSFKGIVINEYELESIESLEGFVVYDALGEYWDYIKTIPAISPRPFDNYATTAPTLHDNKLFTFKVAAVSKTPTQPVLWGVEGSGMSVDNIYPQFSGYSAEPGVNEIIINWEINNNLYTDVKDVRIFKGMFDRFAPETNSMIAVMFPFAETFSDEEITPGEVYYYKLAVTDISGNVTYTENIQSMITSVKEDDNILPKEITLKQNYPNPFNPSTVIEFSIPEAKEVSLKVYNILGTEITELAKGNYAPGHYKILFNVNSGNGTLPSGIYFYTLTAGDYSVTKKLMLLK